MYHTLQSLSFELWERTHQLFMLRAQFVMKVAKEHEYLGWFDEIVGIDYDPLDQVFIIVGRHKEVDPTVLREFRVEKHDFLDPVRWSHKMQEYSNARAS